MESRRSVGARFFFARWPSPADVPAARRRRCPALPRCPATHSRHTASFSSGVCSSHFGQAQRSSVEGWSHRLFACVCCPRMMRATGVSRTRSTDLCVPERCLRTGTCPEGPAAELHLRTSECRRNSSLGQSVRHTIDSHLLAARRRPPARHSAALSRSGPHEVNSTCIRSGIELRGPKHAGEGESCRSARDGCITEMRVVCGVL